MNALFKPNVSAKFRAYLWRTVETYPPVVDMVSIGNPLVN
jgi:hypothetical protein